MIGNPPQQQVHTYHLALSLVILLLTLYPYLFNNGGKCCSVAAYSAEDFGLSHKSIRRFDIIEINDVFLSKPISTRSTQAHLTHSSKTNRENLKESDAIFDEQSGKRRLHFSSQGQRFDMVLSESAHLISNDFNVIAIDGQGRQTTIPFDRSKLQIFEGSLAGDPGSKVVASMGANDGLLTAQIRSGNDMVLVEPTYLHRENLMNSLSDFNSTMNFKLFEKTMIIYKLSDHEQFSQQEDSNFSSKFEPERLCPAISKSNEFNNSLENHEEQQKSDSDTDDIFKFYKSSTFNDGSKKISKRGIDFLAEKTQQAKDKTRCTLHLVADYLFYKEVGNRDLQTTINYLLALINRVNQIYLPTQWETGDEKSETFTNIGFTVQNITIHQEFTRLSSGDIHYNQNSSKIWGAREFLDNFSRYSPPKYYCLAHLLTYRQFDSPVLGLAYVASTRYGTIGGICSPTQHRGDAFYKHNTGISTSKGINGEKLITRQADLVLSHELGHNLGAEHDSSECRPAPAQGGAYLMHPYAVMGFEKNNRFLSNCSRIAIGRVIRRKGPACFVGIVNNVCGNGVVEDDEECDGGDVGHGHSDPCCDSYCRFTPGSQCSDRHSWCCSKCHVVPAGRQCRPAEEFNCKQASYCNGQSAECPPASPIQDDRVCVGRGLCRGGDCIPFCEARELFSCLCNNPADACKLCCKQSINGTCLPYDQQAPYLPDGVLCYRGVCEKGRCEQPIQDVVERLWDVIEDLNFTTFVKFLRDNIILVVLVVSIPIWCLITKLINEFDRRIKQDVINTMMKHRKRHKTPPHSPFLPRLFVGDENSSYNSLNDLRDEANQPLKTVFQFPQPSKISRSHHSVSPPLPTGQVLQRPPHSGVIGFQPPRHGFQLPEGEEVVIEPRGSIAMNSIELPHQSSDQEIMGPSSGEDRIKGSNDGQRGDDSEFDPSNTYSTQV